MPQAPQRIRETGRDTLYEIKQPKGLFNAHQKAPEKLAQKPDESSQTTDPAASPSPGSANSFGFWVNAIKRIARASARGSARRLDKRRDEALARGGGQFEIAPGIKLAHHFYTNAMSTRNARSMRGCARPKTTGRRNTRRRPSSFLKSEVTSSEIVTGLGTVQIQIAYSTPESFEPKSSPLPSSRRRR